MLEVHNKMVEICPSVSVTTIVNVNNLNFYLIDKECHINYVKTKLTLVKRNGDVIKKALFYSQKCLNMYQLMSNPQNIKSKNQNYKEGTLNLPSEYEMPTLS